MPLLPATFHAENLEADCKQVNGTAQESKLKAKEGLPPLPLPKDVEI